MLKIQHKNFNKNHF